MLICAVGGWRADGWEGEKKYLVEGRGGEGEEAYLCSTIHEFLFVVFIHSRGKHSRI
jgi:hypothetical protein